MRPGVWYLINKGLFLWNMAKVSVSDMGKEQIWGTEHIYIIKTIEY